MRHTTEMLVGAAAVLVGLCALLQWRIQPERDRVRDRIVKHMGSKNERVRRQAAELFHAMYLPQAGAMRWLCVGNRNVAADYVLYKSLHYVSLEFPRGGEKMEFLEKMYNVMIDLDPDWRNVHVLAGWMLSSVNQKPNAALRVLDRAIERWPDSYRFHYEAGMICLLNLALRSRACGYFQEASSKQDCPPNIREVAPLICEEVGDLSTALKLAVHQYDQRRAVAKPDSPLVLSSLRLVLEMQTDLLLQGLRQAIGAFRRQHGSPPPNLAMLFQGRRTPTDAFGYPLIYDPRTGDVQSPGRLILRLNRLADFVRRLVEEYQRRHNGRLPPSLDGPPHPDGRPSVIEDIRNAMRGRTQPLPELLVHHLGQELKLPRFPQGFRLNHDPDTGQISVPEGRTMKDLDDRVREISRDRARRASQAPQP